MSASATERQTTVTTIIPVAPKALPEFAETMRTNIAESRKEEGNLSFDAYIVEGGGSQVIVFESWTDQAALDHHSTLPHLKAVNAAVEAHAKDDPTQFWLESVEGLPQAPAAPVPNPAASRNVLVHLSVKPEQKDRFLEVFAKAMGPSRGAPGNLVFNLYAIRDEDCGFVLHERWASIEAHEAHLAQSYNDELSDAFAQVLARPVGEGTRWLMRDISEG